MVLDLGAVLYCFNVHNVAPRYLSSFSFFLDEPDPTVSKAFAGFKFNNRAKSPEISSARHAVYKLRKSKSSADMTENMRKPFKRFEPALETIPSKRTKLGVSTISKPSFKANPIPAAVKKIVNATQSKLIKQNSGPTTTAPIISSTVGASKKAITVAAAKVAIKRIPPYDYKARYADLLDKHKAMKEKLDGAQDSLEQFEKLTDEHLQAQTELNQVKENLARVEGTYFLITFLLSVKKKKILIN